MFQKELISINQINQKNASFVIIHIFLYLKYTYYISVMTYELENVAILNVKGNDQRWVIWNMNKNDAINRLDNSKIR